MLLNRTVIVAFVVGPLLSLPALAVDYTWGGGTGNWNAVNWTPGPVTGPIIAGNSAIINSGTVNVNVAGLNLDLTTIGSGATLNTFNVIAGPINTYGTFSLDLKGGTFSGSGFFTTFGSGILKSVTASGSAASTISAVSSGAFNLTGTGAGATTFNVGDVASGADLTVNAPLWNTSGGTSGLTKTGAGELALFAANTYSGVTNVNQGTLAFSTATSLGNSTGNTIVASGATVYKVGGTALTILEAFDISGTGVGGGGALRFGGNSTNIVSGAVTLGGNASIGTDGGVTLTLSGGVVTAGNTLTLSPTGTALNVTTNAISGTGAVISSGTVNFNVASSYSGGTTLNSGTLNIGAAISGSNSAIGSTSGQLTVNGGTLNMASNNVTVGNLTGAGGIISGTSGTRTLTIGQGNTGGGNFQGQINNGAGGTSALTKTGNGTITLSGTNGYTGATIVSGGKLTIASTGTINSTSGISIGAGELNYNSSTALTQSVSFSGTGGTLSGSGTISSAFNVTTGNTLAIGNSVGVMNFGGDLTVGGTYLFELDNTLNTADLGDVAGNLALGGILDLVQLGAYTVGDKFTLFAYDGSLTGLFRDFGGVTNILDDATFTDAGGIWRLNYNDTTAGLNGGVSATSTYATITSIPEPSAAVLGGLGILLLLRRRR